MTAQPIALQARHCVTRIQNMFLGMCRNSIAIRLAKQ